MYKVLEKINSPKDVKTLTLAELNALADDIRAALLKKLSIHGGHFGPNFEIGRASCRERV